MSLDDFKKLVNEKHITDVTAVESYLTDESKLTELTPEKLYEMGLFTHTSYEVSESEAAEVMSLDDDDMDDNDTTTLEPTVPTDNNDTKVPEEEIVVDDGEDE